MIHLKRDGVLSSHYMFKHKIDTGGIKLALILKTNLRDLKLPKSYIAHLSPVEEIRAEIKMGIRRYMFTRDTLE